MIEKEIYFTVEGKVQPKQRPRVYRNKYTGQVHAITPKKTVEYEEKVRASFLEACEGEKVFFEDAVKLIVTVYVQIPKRVSKKDKNAMICGYIRPIIKNGDVDNYLKAISDALNGYAYKDDSQVVSATVQKYYSEHAGAEIIIREVTR